MPFFEEVCKWEHCPRRRLPFHYLPLKVAPSTVCSISILVPGLLWTQFPYLFHDDLRLTALHGPNMMVCSRVPTRTYSQRTFLRFSGVWSVVCSSIPYSPFKPLCFSPKNLRQWTPFSQKKEFMTLLTIFHLHTLFLLMLFQLFFEKKAKKGIFSFPAHWF